jgi:hypothetical protein
MLDSSLHGEKGAIEGKEQGLTSKQRELMIALKEYHP